MLCAPLHQYADLTNFDAPDSAVKRFANYKDIGLLRTPRIAPRKPRWSLLVPMGLGRLSAKSLNPYMTEGTNTSPRGSFPQWGPKYLPQIGMKLEQIAIKTSIKEDSLAN